jgi:hypothetical protein
LIAANSEWFEIETDYQGPDWLQRLVPDDLLSIFRRVSIVRGPACDNDLKAFGRFSKLRILQIESSGGFGETKQPHVTDTGLAYLANCKNLNAVSAGGGLEITDAGVAHLSERDLSYLELSGTAITDRAIASLLKIKSLATLDISKCNQLTDKGIRRLAELPKLSELNLSIPPQLSEQTFDILRRRENNPVNINVNGRWTDTYAEALETTSP